MTIKQYAKHILKENGCDIYTYGSDNAVAHLMTDLIEKYPNGMEYPYLKVANAILSISRQKPIVRAEYCVSYNLYDSIDCSSLKEAKDTLYHLYRTEMEHTLEIIYDRKTPADDKAILWEQMLYGFDASVQRYNPKTDEYEDYWYPTEKQLESIGWVKRTEF